MYSCEMGWCRQTHTLEDGWTMLLEETEEEDGWTMLLKETEEEEEKKREKAKKKFGHDTT